MGPFTADFSMAENLPEAEYLDLLEFEDEFLSLEEIKDLCQAYQVWARVRNDTGTVRALVVIWDGQAVAFAVEEFK